MAIMMARLYSGNYDLLALRNAYHGMSSATMGLVAHSTWKYNVPQVWLLPGTCAHSRAFLVLP